MRNFLLSSCLALVLLGTAALGPAHAQWRRMYSYDYSYPSYTTYYNVPSPVYYPPATSPVAVQTPVYSAPPTVYSAPMTTYYPSTTSYYYAPAYTPSYYYSYPYYGTYSSYSPWGWRWR